MIASSRITKVLALATATGIHLGASGAFTPDITVEMESSAGAAQAQLGANFADMSAGTLTPAEVENTNEAVEPAPLSATQPPPTQTPQTPLTPVTTPLVTPELTPSPDPTALAVLALTVAQALPPKPQDITPSKPIEQTITAAPDDPSASSPRPTRRDPKLAPKKPVKPVKTAKAAPAKKKAPKAKQDTGKVNNRQGSATGVETAKAKTQGKAKGRAKQSGNAAKSNYPGQVMRRISRVRKPRVNTRGSAVVAFSIASTGGLSKLSIARSSGSAALDKAALGVIRKAQPFPAPPEGARRFYSITIKGR